MEALLPHVLTLLSYASTAGKQVSTLMRDSSNGIGITVPIVDEPVVSQEVAIPAVRVLDLAVSNYSEDGMLFCPVRTVLRLCGIVVCSLYVAFSHRLLEHTYQCTCNEAIVQAVPHRIRCVSACGLRFARWRILGRKQGYPPMIRIGSHPARNIQRCTHISRSCRLSFQQTDGRRQHCQARSHARLRTP